MARCDAWRTFLSSETAAKLRKLRGHVLWFNKYEAFDKLLMEFSCAEKRLLETLRELVVGNHTLPPFRRIDIYDSRSWLFLPLDWFVPISGMNSRTFDERWQNDVLRINEVPILQVGLRRPWTVTRDCFRVIRCTKRRRRLAVMVFDHPDLDSRFAGKRWCAEIECEGKDRHVIENDLFALTAAECQKHLVTIVDPDGPIQEGVR